MTGPMDTPHTGDDTAFQSVAIIGMAGRFPGADDVEAFWQNIADGVESICHYSNEELLGLGVPPEQLAASNYVKAGARMHDAEGFDPEFFDMTPREAEITDPQHRVLLECAYHALENAGYIPNSVPGEVSLYAGVGMNTYLLTNLMPRTDILRTLGMHQLLLGNDKCYATSRIAYKLNLRGACVSVDTACSSGLVALTLAYRSLVSLECDMALAGGAKVNSADAGYPYEPGSINSPDGHCRTFDAQARGTVFGSGGGMLVLKRLDDALRDRDTVHAVIRGAAINNDGSAKVGFTAPSVTRQRDVIRQALAYAEIDPASIGYVEAHGTGTQLGDPVELAALAEAFGPNLPAGSCAIGSVKPNIGHLESAAGVAGVIKVVQAMRHRKLPPSINFEQANPALELQRSPFHVNTRLTGWDTGSAPRRACVSSFGMGGTNAHVVLEEAPAMPAGEATTSVLLPLSALRPDDLAQVATRLRDRLLAPDAPALTDAAFTLSCGRQGFPHRAFVVAGDHPAAAAALVQLTPGQAGTPATALLLPGQGVQYPGMAAMPYAQYPVYRDALEACLDVLAHRLDVDLRGLLLASGTADDAALLAQTRYAQPAIFATAYAASRLWMSWGGEPSLLIGHSLGEYVAACLAGVFSLEDALSLVCARAALMQSMPEGAMASLRLSEAEVCTMLAQRPELACSIAAVNGPVATVVSGSQADVAACADSARAVGADATLLRTSHAFHSALMDPMLDAFRAAMSGVVLSAPRIPLTSSLTGALLRSDEATDPDYWVRQLRGCVRFVDAIATAAAQGVTMMIDVGPNATAAGMARASAAASVTVLAAATSEAHLPRAHETLLGALGQAWSRGMPVAWEAVHRHRAARRVPLPGYPFARRRCWIDPPAVAAAQPSTPLQAADVVAVVKVAAQAAPDEAATGIEATIASIWTELLGITPASANDSFFALGGQSLLATRLLARIEERCGVALPMQTVFDNPTLAGLALAVLQHRAQQEDPELLEALLAQIEQDAHQTA